MIQIRPWRQNSTVVSNCGVRRYAESNENHGQRKTKTKTAEQSDSLRAGQRAFCPPLGAAGCAIPEEAWRPPAFRCPQMPVRKVHPENGRYSLSSLLTLLMSTATRLPSKQHRYEISRRPTELGGGWHLQCFSTEAARDFEISEGAFPAFNDTDEQNAYADAMQAR